MTWPLKTKQTRYPLPSKISQPVATSRLSIADHSMVPEIGSVKIATSVLRCLLLMHAYYGASKKCKHDGAQRKHRYFQIGMEFLCGGHTL
jgi:hypothetical protein